ncbi:MAG: aminotransferase class V-fold PLP-dependent enzyme, partial [Thermodesulfobacteriota bacterium]|nr:aminotransferase class V-fold PLP-dependent enzyme [Thermodesulfobacteriota bacterium]
MKSVYADNNATTRVDPQVVEEMLPYFSDLYGNPSSMHYFGGQVEQKVVQAREQIAQLINCDPSEIIFTSCGTESDSTAIKGTLGSYPDKKHLVTSRVEHPAVLNLCRHLNKNGYELSEIPVDKKGNINLDDVEASITDNTAVVSIMYANN